MSDDCSAGFPGGAAGSQWNRLFITKKVEDNEAPVLISSS
jgi:hypothetical protein